MSDHIEASLGSKNMCQKLFDCLAEKIPNLKRSQSKNWCGFYQAGRNRFAYISHRKQSSDIQIWCSGDVEDLLNESRIEVIPREEIKSGWEEKYPARFYVKSDLDIDPACDLLYKISYPTS